MTTANASRIYVISDATGSYERLIRASHPGTAQKAATRVRVASQSDLERLLTKGVRVEDATAAADAQGSLTL